MSDTMANIINFPERDEKLSRRLKKTEYAFYPVLYAIAVDIYNNEPHNKSEVMDIYLDVAKEFCYYLKEFDNTIESKVRTATTNKYRNKS